MGAGVSAAVFEYVKNTPEFEHHLLYVERAETKSLPAGWQRSFASVELLPPGHFSRIRAVRRAALRIAPGAVHSHSSFAGLYARLAFRNSALMQHVYTPHCYAFERLDLSPAARAAYRAAERLLSLNTGTVAGCSPRETALGKNMPGRGGAVYLPNSTVLPRFDAPGSKVSVRTDLLRLAGAGRLGPQKDPVFFLTAVNALRQHGYTVQASWFGGGDEGLHRKLEAAGIQVTGWLPREQLLSRMATTDVYLHSAAWEGFPLAVLESGALRVATVVRNIPAFEGFDLPLRISSPADLVPLWEDLRNPFRRLEIAERSAAALAMNNAAAQRRALLEIYPGAGVSRGIPQESESVPSPR